MSKKPFFQFNPSSQPSDIPVFEISPKGDREQIGNIKGNLVGDEILFDLTLQNC